MWRITLTAWALMTLWFATLGMLFAAFMKELERPTNRVDLFLPRVSILAPTLSPNLTSKLSDWCTFTHSCGAWREWAWRGQSTCHSVDTPLDIIARGDKLMNTSFSEPWVNKLEDKYPEYRKNS